MLSVHYDTRAIAYYIMVPLVPLVPLVHGGQPHHRHSKFCCSVLHCHILKLLTAASNVILRQVSQTIIVFLSGLRTKRWPYHTSHNFDVEACREVAMASGSGRSTSVPAESCVRGSVDD